MKNELLLEVETIVKEFFGKFNNGKVVSEYFAQADEWIISVDKETINSQEFLMWSLAKNDSLWAKRINKISFAELSKSELDDVIFDEMYNIWYSEAKTLFINEQNAIGLTSGVFFNVCIDNVFDDANGTVVVSDLKVTCGNKNEQRLFGDDENVIYQTQFNHEGLAA